MSEFITQLPEDFVAKYKDLVPPWGPVGYVTYKRTYARRIEKEKRTEEWHETIQRCVNGLLKIGGKFTLQEAQDLYDSVFNLKCSFSGRALWQLGTKTVDRLGGDSLQNCWVVAADGPVEPFCFTFNELMLGGGVGFNIQAEYVYEIPRVKYSPKVTRIDEKDVDFVVPDNREGWVELLRRVLQAFFFTGKSFTYSTICIRGKGSLIKSFGGTASGPEDLCKGIDNIVKVLRARVGKKLRPVDCLDIFNIIGEIVVAGNVRRSAQLALGDMSDHQYLEAKNWALGTIPNWRSKSNNSIACNKFEFLPEKFWQNYNGEGEPYGLINLSNCREFGRLADGKDYRPDPKVVGTNPCLTGDTLVYVADGRGDVPIRQLAEEGKDVPVFCRSSSGALKVRYMRNPRLTGQKKDIVKITLDDGSVLRTTQNHKFILMNGQALEAAQLQPGFALRILTKFEASIKDVFKQANSNSQDYWWLRQNSTTHAEHRMIAAFAAGREIARNEVVHHRDFDAKNNAPSNLEIMDREAHNLLHSRNMIGDKNPMRRAHTEWSAEKWADYRAKQSAQSTGLNNKNSCGETNEALREHAKALCLKVGRRFSREEWQEYAREIGLPLHFSKWRMDHLGGIQGLSKWAAAECGFDKRLIDLDPRVVRSYMDCVHEGYDADIIDGAVEVTKACEICGIKFTAPLASKEQGVCSATCANKRSWQDETVRANRSAGIRKTYDRKLEETRNKQLSVYTEVKFDMKREPWKAEWVEACKKKGISHEISRKTSPFRTWGALKEAASMHNHRVVSVEPDGVEDVFTGTVDEFHNFYIGGFESKTANGKMKKCYILTLQCGEVPLQSAESCNLAEVFLPNIKDVEELKKVTGLMYKVTKTISCLPFIHSQTNEVVSQNHRLGIGLTGFLQAPHMQNADILTAAYRNIEALDEEYSKIMGVGKSIKMTTVKPSGTLSLLAGVTPGVHPAYSQYYIRRIRMASSDPLVPLCRKHGFHTEPVKNFDGTLDRDTIVVSFPVKVPEGTVCAKDLTAIQQLEWHKFLQTWWADNSVSVTVYYRKEELPDIKRWLAENYDNSVKSVSFLLHSEHGFKQAPYEEITKEEYDRMAAATQPITRVHDEKEMSLAESVECAGGSCPIK